MKQGSVKKLVARYLVYSSMFFLFFIAFNLLIASILFIFNVSVKSWYVIVSGFCSLLLMILWLRKKNLLDFRSILFVIIIPIFVIMILTFVNGKIYDRTDDGNSYHKVAIGLMSDGWNPLYETEAEFVDGVEDEISLIGHKFWWGDAYAKMSYIFSANMMSLTGNIESGKVLNSLSVIVVFMMFFGICLYLEKTWLFSVCLAILAVTTTTISSQLLTNYIDILVYLYMFLLASLFFWFEYAKEYKKEMLVIFSITLIFLINIKFSAFVFAGILCSFYYIWYIYRYFKDKKFDKAFFKQFSIISIISVIVGVFIIGLSTYPRNLVVYGHPFYPLMGENKIDIMTKNQPVSFSEKNNIEKFIIATFSKADNINQRHGGEASFKIPFSIHENEMEWLGNYDLRISGNGLLFGGILIVSIIVVVLYFYKLLKDDKRLFMMLMIPIISTILLIVFVSEVWWARYFPQIYYIVFASLIILDKYKSKINNIVKWAMIVILAINNIMYGQVAVADSYNFSKTTRNMMIEFRNIYPPSECKVLELSTIGYSGAYFNGRMNLGDYNNIIYTSYDREELPNYLYLMPYYLAGRCRE